MTAFVYTRSGEGWQLPAALGWELEYTTGSPCDSFWMRCPWDLDNAPEPGGWVRFRATDDNGVLFEGVVDECEASLSQEGALLELSGRGMAALLLDNEALGQDYETATLADILRDHVMPYGISVGRAAELPPVEKFSVATGSSEWAVLEEFCRYYGGIAPRFDQNGRLILAPWDNEKSLLIGDGTPVTRLLCRDRRYGVLSQMLVRDRYQEIVQQVGNQRLRDGMCRRVMTMPGKSNFKAMRYNGQFQVERSSAELLRLEVDVPIPFFAQPGDLVRISRTGWRRNGLYRAAKVKVGTDRSGAWSRLELAPPDILL